MSEAEKPKSEAKSEVKADSKKESKPVAKPEEKKQAKPDQKMGSKEPGYVAVVLIRGRIGIDHDIILALDSLSLHNRNYCSVHKATPSIMGTIKKCKDFVTWGEISEATLKELISKRSEKNPKDEKKTKKFFRLNSPKKGYGRKGIKMPFSKGGSLGPRGDKIDDLIKRMI